MSTQSPRRGKRSRTGSLDIVQNDRVSLRGWVAKHRGAFLVLGRRADSS